VPKLLCARAPEDTEQERKIHKLMITLGAPSGTRGCRNGSQSGVESRISTLSWPLTLPAGMLFNE
jgi:hypothetical protein